MSDLWRQWPCCCPPRPERWRTVYHLPIRPTRDAYIPLPLERSS